jgi:aminopeptidase N
LGRSLSHASVKPRGSKPQFAARCKATITGPQHREPCKLLAQDPPPSSMTDLLRRCWRIGALLLLRAGLLALPLLLQVQVQAQERERPQARPQAVVPDVRHYEVQLTPDIQAQHLRGRVLLHLRAPSARNAKNAQGSQQGATAAPGPSGEAPRWQLDAGAGLVIDAVRERGQALRFEKTADLLFIEPDAPAAAAHPAAERVLEIEFHGTPKHGMRWLPQQQQVYTVFSTSQWMPCVDSPDQRATLAMTLDLPPALKLVANGRLVRSELLASGLQRSHWLQEDAVPSYLFGFVAGPFREVVDDSASPTLHFLGPESLSEQELRAIFADTRSMLAFYESKAGLPYPGTRYTQVLAALAPPQEAAGFGLLSEAYGRRVLADPLQAWLIAHELSHQWWGNGVTNGAWTHFWLNEGLASFMNAAWFEHRHGPAAYQQQLQAARGKYERVQAAGADKPLVFPAWQSPTAMDRSLVYDKGALFVARLREAMGEVDFWRGIKAYTQQHWGRAVQSQDFQIAMQAATAVNLSELFQLWVNPSRP